MLSFMCGVGSDDSVSLLAVYRSLDGPDMGPD